VGAATVFQNVVSKIDGGTGAVTVNEEVTFSRLNESHLVCPGSNGGKNWPAGAYSPLTNTMYMPMQNMCMTATTTTDQRDPSKVYGLTMAYSLAPGASKVGAVWAISAENRADCVETGASERARCRWLPPAGDWYSG